MRRDLTHPITLKAEAAREYLGVSDHKFRELRARGIIEPLPIIGTFAVSDLEAVPSKKHR